jgi:hypothetical protein
MTKDELRWALFVKQEGECVHCKRRFDLAEVKSPLVDLQRIVPRRSGGEFRLENLQLAHATCAMANPSGEARKAGDR